MDVVTWAEIHHLAHKAAKHFGLRDFHLRPMPPKDRRITCWGECEVETKAPPVIRIRLHCLEAHPTKRRRALARSTVLQYIAHELAHLRFPNHDAGHRGLMAELHQWLKQQPIA